MNLKSGRRGNRRLCDSEKRFFYERPVVLLPRFVSLEWWSSNVTNAKPLYPNFWSVCVKVYSFTCCRTAKILNRNGCFASWARNKFRKINFFSCNNFSLAFLRVLFNAVIFNGKKKEKEKACLRKTVNNFCTNRYLKWLSTFLSDFSPLIIMTQTQNNRH